MTMYRYDREPLEVYAPLLRTWSPLVQGSPYLTFAEGNGPRHVRFQCGQDTPKEVFEELVAREASGMDATVVQSGPMEAPPGVTRWEAVLAGEW